MRAIPDLSTDAGIQEALLFLGYGDGLLINNIRLFQEAHSLKVDGIVGSITMAAILKDLKENSY